MAAPPSVLQLAQAFCFDALKESYSTGIRAGWKAACENVQVSGRFLANAKGAKVAASSIPLPLKFFEGHTFASLEVSGLKDAPQVEYLSPATRITIGSQDPTLPFAENVLYERLRQLLLNIPTISGDPLAPPPPPPSAPSELSLEEMAAKLTASGYLVKSPEQKAKYSAAVSKAAEERRAAKAKRTAEIAENKNKKALLAPTGESPEQLRARRASAKAKAHQELLARHAEQKAARQLKHAARLAEHARLKAERREKSHRHPPAQPQPRVLSREVQLQRLARREDHLRKELVNLRARSLVRLGPVCCTQWTPHAGSVRYFSTAQQVTRARRLYRDAVLNPSNIVLH